MAKSLKISAFFCILLTNFRLLLNIKKSVMYKRLLLFVLISAIITACGNSGKNDVQVKQEGADASAKVEFASLSENPDNYVGKTISVEGKVVHVCTQSGKKMFLVGENPDIRLFIAAGETISKFPMELLGSEITVEGVITKRASQQTAKTEGMPKEGNAEMAADSCETEKALAAQTSMTDIIMEYKSHVVK